MPRPRGRAGGAGPGTTRVFFNARGGLGDPDDKEEMTRSETVNERMVMRALAMGGTCTGEHGIGFGKMHLLESEHGEAVSVMRQMKLALDPADLMNPGKIVRI